VVYQNSDTSPKDPSASLKSPAATVDAPTVLGMLITGGGLLAILAVGRILF
jgi:hypothetical protein